MNCDSAMWLVRHAPVELEVELEFERMDEVLGDEAGLYSVLPAVWVKEEEEDDDGCGGNGCGEKYGDERRSESDVGMYGM